MSKDGTYWIAVVLMLTAVVVLAIVAVKVPAPLAGSAPLTAAGALAVITGGSVAIERALEAFWTVVDMIAARPWPLGIDARRFRDGVDAVGSSLRGRLQELEADVDKYRAALPAAPDRQATVDAVRARTAAIRACLQGLRRAADGATVAKALGSIGDAIDGIVERYPVLTDGRAIDEIVGESVAAATALQGIVAAFDANPARRLVSILAGCSMGLGAAFLLGLNVFSAAGVDGGQAVGAAGGLSGAGGASAGIWIAVTGIVMGLGSTPTHEIIKAVQAQKDKGKAA